MSSLNSLLQQIIKDRPDSKIIEQAFELAKEAHEGQKRFSGEDYIWHPLKVAQILNEMKLDSKTIAAGLLHDVPEDTTVTLDDIEEKFGKEISFLVDGVSKLGKLRYPKTEVDLKPIKTRAKNPIDIHAENLRKMFFAMAEDIRVILIKLADRMDNMRTIKYLPKEKQKRFALETLEIFAPLASRLGMGELRGSLEDLAFPCLYPTEYKWLESQIKERYAERIKYLKKLRTILIKILRKERIETITIDFRVKHYWSLYQKLLKHDMDLEKIYDLVALRIIAKDVESCYKVLGIIHKYWKPMPGRIKDYISLPKPTGYQSLHTTVFCVSGKITEIQIKTPEMHEEAEHGIAAHWAKKEGVGFNARRKKFSWVSQLADWQKETIKSQEFLEGLKIDFFKNRIFIFTPKGDVIDLPDGATAIDFAYSLHTELGNHCSSAKINGKITPLSHSLKNGDMLEIIIDKNKKPSRDWLDFVKTNIAKTRIKEFLKKESLPENFNKGLLILNREFQQI
ncbi:MAG: RelA/SpoT family protein, partial [Candidatus Parcubacteria bacterium]|nr:RelA/SpoT family protein [Candidatus Parcubacteria bacterium]